MYCSHEQVKIDFVFENSLLNFIWRKWNILGILQLISRNNYFFLFSIGWRIFYNLALTLLLRVQLSQQLLEVSLRGNFHLTQMAPLLISCDAKVTFRADLFQNSSRSITVQLLREGIRSPLMVKSWKFTSYTPVIAHESECLRASCSESFEQTYSLHLKYYVATPQEAYDGGNYTCMAEGDFGTSKAVEPLIFSQQPMPSTYHPMPITSQLGMLLLLERLK